jgi:hypothetical protein
LGWITFVGGNRVVDFLTGVALEKNFISNNQLNQIAGELSNGKFVTTA